MIITKDDLKKGNICIKISVDEYPGVKRVAKLVARDIELVFGEKIEVVESEKLFDREGKFIIVGTLRQSSFVSEFNDHDAFVEGQMYEQRETYLMNSYQSATVIFGSDKRGTIYGLFKLSEMLGVSPFVNWNNVIPERKESVDFGDVYYVSKEPSVRYRGFFINDEWPAFGNWCEKNFGGFNSKCYERVFELLLRLKGNYMWPAMWSAIFSNDGPDLENAKLADEMGVIMGMSHHEPCLRNGEEYKYLRGKDSVYGDAWNFRTNEAGITRFWEDGLKRSGQFENVITVGMRGEADSTIMGKDATLKDNIDLLRDVLKCQNKLIRENVNEDLDEVPRMLALYKEVEPFYYGDENTEGLMNCEELEGVTLMLCDDNFGNLRTVPTEKMRSHKGGFGMYYHFDYHGWPISYEWINSSYLPKVWDQMTTAYEFGIRDLWIVNVGDIFTMEYPLSFFLDMAYDFDKWGTSNVNAPSEYTKEWVNTQLGASLTKEQIADTDKLLRAYTKIASARRPEAMNENVYPANNGLAEKHSDTCEQLMTLCQKIYDEIPENKSFPFFQFVYYPLMGNLNVQKMWTDTGLNHFYAKMGATVANEYAARVQAAIRFDDSLIEKLHTMEDGKWYGMGMSEHIGFKNWNEEECQKPVVHQVFAANKPRIIVLNPETGAYTEGGDWTARRLDLEVDDNGFAYLYLLSASEMDAKYEIVNVDEDLLVAGDVNASSISTGLPEQVSEGVIKAGELCKLRVYIKPSSSDKNGKTYTLKLHTQSGGNINVDVHLSGVPGWKNNTYRIEAGKFTKTEKSTTDEAVFTTLPEYGKENSGLKVIPVISTYPVGKGPSVSYDIDVPKAGKYTLSICSTPTNPPFMDGVLDYGVQIGGGEITVVQALPRGFKVGDDQAMWMNGVLDNIRVNNLEIECEAGGNQITLWAMSPQFILQWIELKQN